METKASYVVVGVFALLIVAGSLLFVLWAAKNSKGSMRTYEVVFNQSVAGLSVGGGVLLEGVRIGQVARINVSPTDPGQVIVHVQVNADAPIRQNSFATLEPQGVTGTSAVALSGGTADSPLLVEAEGGLARIPSKPSKLQQIMNSVPSILASLDGITTQINRLITTENMESFGTLLTSVTQIAESLARNRESLSSGMAGFGDAGQSFAESGKRLEKLMASAQTLVETDIRNATRSVDKAAAQIGSVAAAAAPGLDRFSRGSVEELHRLLVEARRLMTNLSGIVQKLESDPRRFLLGNPVPEFSVP